MGVQPRRRILEPGARGVAEGGHSHLRREPRGSGFNAAAAQRRGQGVDQTRRLGQHALLQRWSLGDDRLSGSVNGRLPRAPARPSGTRRAAPPSGSGLRAPPGLRRSRRRGKPRRRRTGPRACREVPKEGPLGDAGLGGDLGRGRGLVAALAEQLQGACCRRRRAASPLPWHESDLYLLSATVSTSMCQLLT